MFAASWISFLPLLVQLQCPGMLTHQLNGEVESLSIAQLGDIYIFHQCGDGLLNRVNLTVEAFDQSVLFVLIIHATPHKR